jgi:hypothetical protein
MIRVKPDHPLGHQHLWFEVFDPPQTDDSKETDRGRHTALQAIPARM